MVVLVLFLTVNVVCAVLPFPLFDLNLPLNDHFECMDYSSDCSDRAGLCKNDAFKDIMHSKCAKTCQICGEILEDDDFQGSIYTEAPKNNKGVDKERNRYIAVDLDKSISPEFQNSEENLSESLEYHNMNHMILRPPSTPPPRRVQLPAPPSRKRIRNCVDEAPNCFYLKSLCMNKFYMPVMQKNCRKTCGFCESGPRPSPPSRYRPHSRISPAGMGGWTDSEPQWPEQRQNSMNMNMNNNNVDQCSNRGLDCEEKLNLCTHWRYWRLMRRICALSCGFCDPEY